MSTTNNDNKGEQLYLLATATLMPFRMDMSILERSGPKEINKDDLEEMWKALYPKAKTSGSNSDSGAETTKVATTRSSGRVPIDAKMLFGIRQRARALPDILQKAGDNSILAAEASVAKYKKSAAKILAANVGKQGADEIRPVIEEINKLACTVYVIEVYLKRTSFTSFEGSKIGTDGLHHGTVKLRKLYSQRIPDVSLLQLIMKEISSEDRRLAYDNTLVIASLDGRTREGKSSSFGIVPRGWNLSDDKDLSIAKYLQKLRNNSSS